MKMRVSIAIALLGATFASAQVDPGLYQNMSWRSIGPYRGGRSVAVAGSVQRPKEYYFGATGGGVWKTTDGGTEWAPVSDGFFNTASVGALAVAPSNPDIVYAGTGEKDIRGNISHGDGMYKSLDAGKTWTHIGLKECQTIARIIVHPTNPDIAYVAALGHIYVKRDLATGKVDADPNRGIYKTTDGGKTWGKVLFKHPATGGIDVEFDPSNPEIVYAALWEAWRTPYMMNSGGDFGGLFKSTDGGKSWNPILAQDKGREANSKGWPKQTVGKIGFAVSPVNPKRLYAVVEALDGGIFRSDDAGATWTKTNEDRNWRQRAWYYSHVVADPKDADGVYILNVGMGKSSDGGKTFRGVNTPHSDNHDLWIAPDDPKRMIESNDGGANVSVDGGLTWTDQDLPTGQFYHVTTDNDFPYRILGAQQDNSTVRIPSRVQGGGITATDWTGTAGGESGYVAADPKNPDIVYGGSYGGDLTRLIHRTNKSRSVDVYPDNPMGHGAVDLVHRFQWTYPIVFSPHDPKTLYTCSQFVMKTTNEGQTWKAISPDLTRNDPRTLGPSGGPITKDNTSVEYYGTVFTFAESPVAPGTLWAGSDDGLVHVSRDGGGSWQKVTPSGMPEWGLCSMVEPSHFTEGTAYLAVDNHENDDYKPYIFITRDFGRTWRQANTGIPDGSFVRVVREDPKTKGLLFAGTETGLFVSFDDGSTWQPFNLNLPLTPVHDLVVKENDLIAATHGRGFWVLDDITPLQQIRFLNVAEPKLFQPRDAYRVQWGGGGGRGGGRRGGGGGGGTVGQNAPSGILANFYLPEKAEKVTVELLDADGVSVAKSEPSAEKGLNRVALYPRYPSYRSVSWMIMWGAFPAPIPAPPGEYTIKLTVGDKSQTASVNFIKDPRSECTDADLKAQTEFAMRVRDRMNDANDAVLKIRDLKKKIDEAVKGEPAVGKKADLLKTALSAVEEEIYQVKNQSGQDPLNYPIKLNNRIGALLGIVLSGDARPTDGAYLVFASLTELLQVQLDKLDKLVKTDLVGLNKDLLSKGKEIIE